MKTILSLFSIALTPAIQCKEVQENSRISFSGELRTSYLISVKDEDDDDYNDYDYYGGEIAINAHLTEKIKAKLSADLETILNEEMEDGIISNDKAQRSLENGNATIEIHQVGGYPLVIIMGKMTDDTAFGEKKFGRSWNIKSDKLYSLRSWNGVIGITAKLSDLPGFWDVLETSVFESSRGNYDVSEQTGYSIRLQKKTAIMDNKTKFAVSFLDVGNNHERVSGKNYKNADRREERVVTSVSMDMPQYNTRFSLSAMYFTDNVYYSDTSDHLVKGHFQYRLSDEKWIHSEYARLNEHSQSLSTSYWVNMKREGDFHLYWGIGIRKFDFVKKKDEWIFGTQLRLLLDP